MRILTKNDPCFTKSAFGARPEQAARLENDSRRQIHAKCRNASAQWEPPGASKHFQPFRNGLFSMIVIEPLLRL